MEEKKKVNKNWFYAGALLAIIALVVIALNWLDNQTEKTNAEEVSKKVVSINTVANEVMKAIQNRDERSLDKYLANGYVYIDSNNGEHNYIREFWDDLEQDITENSEMVKRGNSIENEATYYIHWNIPKGTTSQYARQIIMLYFKKIENKTEVTYQVYKIILRNN